MRLSHIFCWMVLVQTCALTTGNAWAQEREADSSVYQAAVAAARSQYAQAIGDQAGIYNGPRYPGYPFLFRKGSPFYHAGSADTGSLRYDGILYENILLWYEDLKDVVIINDNGYQIQLNNKKVDTFSIPGHRFIRPGKPDANNLGLNTGFYELLYAGPKISILKKAVKSITEDLSQGHMIERTVDSTDYFYLMIGNGFFPVDNSRAVVRALPDNQEAVQLFIRKNKLKFRRHEESFLLQVVAYYEGLQ